MVQRNYSRREILLGLFSKWRTEDMTGGITGFSARERAIDRHLQRKNFQPAKDLLQELVQMSPEHLQARCKLGFCLLQIGELEGAAQELQTVLSQKPEDNSALLYLGLTKAFQGDLQSALQFWAQYYNPEQPAIQREINLLLALQDMGELTSARKAADNIQQALEKQQH